MNRVDPACRSLTATAVRTAVVAILVVVTAVGCGRTVSGYAGPGMSPVAVDTLDHGLFPTEPTEFAPDVDTSIDVYSFEARRMFEFLVSPHQVDSELRFLDNSELVVDEGPAFGSLLPAEFESPSTQNFLVSGAITSRGNNSPRREKHMVIGLLRFGSESLARTAATEFDRILDGQFPGRERLAISGHPGASASLSPARDRAHLLDVAGAYVVFGSITAPPDQADRVSEDLRKLLDLQLAALRDLVPTPPDDMLDLPRDRDGIMRMTLPDESMISMALSDIGAYPARAHRHFEGDAGTIPDYDPYDVDFVGRNGSTVYRTGGPAQAFALQTVLTRPGDYDEEIPGPPGLPDARCLVRETTSLLVDTHICVLVQDRYVAMVGGTGIGTIADPELFQKMAAQYLLLVNSA
ncbi:DUF7373 family lipoprotein [Nocardia sp. NPDC003345]